MLVFALAMVKDSPNRRALTPTTLLGVFGRFGICGICLGVLHILPTTGLTGVWPSTVRIAGTVYIIAVIYNQWRKLASSWFALFAGLVTGISYFGVSLYWLGSSANPDPHTLIPREILLSVGRSLLIFPMVGSMVGVGKNVKSSRKKPPHPYSFQLSFCGI